MLVTARSGGAAERVLANAARYPESAATRRTAVSIELPISSAFASTCTDLLLRRPRPLVVEQGQLQRRVEQGSACDAPVATAPAEAACGTSVAR